MHVRKEKAGGSSTGHVWEHDGAIVEVDDHIGGLLLEHSKEFSDVTAQVLAEQAEDAETDDTDGDEPKPKRKYTRRAAATQADTAEVAE